MSRRTGIWFALGGVLVLGLVAAAVFVTGPKVAAVEQHAVPQASTQDLELVSGSRVVFAHQSVGQNVLDGVRGLYAERGLRTPRISDPQGEDGIDDVLIGTNGDPLGKIRAFDALMRGPDGGGVDVAVLKLCYVDVVAGTDVDEIFRSYRDTMAALSRDFPNTSFVAATVPLSSQRDLERRVKAFLGRDEGMGPADNAAREGLNRLIRAEYAGQGRLFDVAAAQSTASNGERFRYEVDGATYYAMLDQYSADPGHLNPAGSEVAANAFLATVATQLSRNGHA